MEPVNVRPFLALGALPVEAPAAVGTEHLPLENVWGVGPLWDRPAFLTDLFPVFLHRCKELITDDWFMGASCNNQVVLPGLNLLMVHDLCLSLHQIAGVDLAFQNLHYGACLPFPAPDQARAGDLPGGFFVMAGRCDPHFIQVADDTVQRHMPMRPLKNLPYDRGGIFIDQQFMAVVRVFAVAVGRPCADIIAVFHGLPCLGLDLPANVQCVSLVYHIFQGKHNTAVEAAGVCRVKLVRDRNKTDVVGMEILFDIITGINGIPSQPGEVLDNHTVNMARLDIRKHLLETGAVEVRARRPIVDIGIIDNEIRFVRKEIIQHQLLVFHRTAPLFIILHRKTDIERHMHI